MMSEYKYELIDDDGASIDNLLQVDGMISGTFGFDPDVIAGNIRNLKKLTLRDDDVMLCTPPKAGTHWGHEIMNMLVRGNAEPIKQGKLETMLIVQSQQGLDKIPAPRVLNAHLTYDQLPEEMKKRKTKTVLILRNPKDSAVSYYHHNRGINHYNYSGKWEPFLKWFMEGKLECNSWFDYVKSFEKGMKAKEFPIHLVFYEDLKEDSLKEVKKIAKFLGVKADDKLCKEIAEKCDFKAMEERTPYKTMTQFMKKDFWIFRKGTVGDWENYFTVAQNKAFDALYKKEMADSKIKFKYELKQ